MLLLGGWLIGIGLVGLTGMISESATTLLNMVAVAAGVFLLLGR